MDIKYEMQDYDEVLQSSIILYNQGKYRNCIEKLNEVCFTTFDLKEWEFENNKLMCQIKMEKSHEPPDQLMLKFQALWEKTRGLPCHLETLSLVTSVGLNFCFLLISQYTNKAVDCHLKTGEILSDNILRAEVLNSPVKPQISKGKQEIFTSSVLNDVLNVGESLLSQSIQTDLILLNCYFLSLLWMSQHQVDQGFKLLSILNRHLEINKGVKTTSQNTIIVDPSVAKQPFPLSLLTCSREQGFCVKSSVVFLMSLYLKFCKSDNQKALDLLLSHDVSSFYGHYLQGWLFYENMKLDESMNSLNLCINMMDVTDCSKAAALCMAGCCLAKKDKPNMAIAKLKEALSFDFDHLDALFHIAQQQQKLEEYDGEMKSLHYLCEALETQNKSNSIPICATSLLQGPFIPFVKSLYGKTISLEYARYWLGKRCLQLHRFSEASDALIDVVAAVTSDKFQASVSDNTLPSSVYLYRDCAFAMLKANKTKECVTLCDHGIKVLEDVDCVTATKDRVGKRQRQAMEYTANAILELMLCKAFAMLSLGQPLISLQILQRGLDEIESSLQHNNEDKELDCRILKRRKMSSDVYDDNAIDETLLDGFHNESEENLSLLQIKSEAHMIRGTVLRSLDKEKESLEELYQSLVCDPENASAVYHYTKLLFKLGSKKAAASNWMKYKELRPDALLNTSQKSKNNNRPNLPFLFDITDKEIQDLDRLAMRYC